MIFGSRDFSRDIASVTAACVFHGALFLTNPGVRWGLAQDDESDAVQVEFVQAPPPSPLLAPVPPSGDGTEGMPAHGAGDFQAEQVKAGSPEAAKTQEDKQLEERRRALAKAYRERMERLAEAQDKRRVEARRASRLASLAKTQEQAKARAELARRRAEEREQARQAAAMVRAQRRARQAELSQALASIPSPDEELYDAPNAQPSDPKGKKDAPAAAAAAPVPAPAGVADPVFDAEGKEGPDPKNVKPAGGGPANDSGGVGWSLEGPIGNRRMMSRRLPTCPDWVSERDLDLSVQIKFQVLEDGTIRRGRVIKRTSGFPDLDKRAMDALNEWKFEQIPAGGAVETWGVVTFRFTAG
jgi:TonB family protein